MYYFWDNSRIALYIKDGCLMIKRAGTVAGGRDDR